MAAYAKMKGWFNDRANARLAVVYNGTHVVRYTATAITQLVATAVTGGITATTGDVTATAGNTVLGTPGAFATTQGVAMVKMGGSSLGGVAPVGAITTAGGVFASDTAVMKIVAGGTADTIQT